MPHSNLAKKVWGYVPCLVSVARNFDKFQKMCFFEIKLFVQINPKLRLELPKFTLFSHLDTPYGHHQSTKGNGSTTGGWGRSVWGSILAKFAILEAKNIEITYFTRALLPNCLRKFYKINYIITKPHLRRFQNANKNFNNIFIYAVFPPTNFDSLTMLKKVKKDAILMVKNGILLGHSDFCPLQQ